VSQDTFTIKDFGLDLPLGGLGNPVPRDHADQLFIGPSGTPYKASSGVPAFVKDLQHGHLFLGMYEFSLGRGMVSSKSPSEFCPEDDERGSQSATSFFSKTSKSKTEMTSFVGGLLIGLESSAPLKTDLFGKKHGIDGASKFLSAFGKQKWKNYELSGLCIPKHQGGIQMDVDAERLMQLERIFSQLNLCSPSHRYKADRAQSDEKCLFKQLLQSSACQASQIIFNSFDLNAESDLTPSCEEAYLRRNARSIGNLEPAPVEDTPSSYVTRSVQLTRVDESHPARSYV
jgi:hypothetical protein